MKKLTCYNIQDMIRNDNSINFIIEDIDNIIKSNQLDINLYNNLANQLINMKKNIIAIYKNDELFAFLIISEKVISDIYIKKTNFYKKYLDILMNEAYEFLDNPKPVVILSRDDTIKYINYIFSNNCNVSALTKDGKLIFNDQCKMDKQIIRELRKF